MACTNPENPTCQNCNKAGLAILPVRYAVVPSTVFAFLPAALPDKLADVKLSHHRYALRTLREGYVYLFYEKNARGVTNCWEVYSVAPTGTLWKQISIMSVNGMPEEPACARKGHNIPASVINIENPEKCGRVWIAFSQHEWSPNTFADFAANAKLRARRMQSIEPAKWVKSKTDEHGLEATKANIETVIEYQDKFDTLSMSPSTLPVVSSADGKHIDANLKKCSTRYPLSMRKGQSEKLAALMKQIGEFPKGHHPGMVLALKDAVGITHELNGYRNDSVGWMKKYSLERELELTAMSALDGVRKALETKAGQEARRSSEFGIWRWTAAESAKRKANAQRLYANDPVRIRHEIDLCDRWERDAAQKAPSSIVMPRQYSVTLSDEAWAANMARIDAQLARYKAPNPSTGKSAAAMQEERSQRFENKAIAEAWPKYKEKLSGDYEKFSTNYKAFLAAATKLVDDRTDDLLAWIESPALIDALTEYHEKDIDDGISFEDAVGDMVFGMSSSAKGQQKFAAWAKETKSSEYNLLWRAMALNQKERKEEIDVALQHAQTGRNVVLTAESWAAVGVNIKWNKLASVYKSAQTFSNTNIKAAASGGSMKEFKMLGFLKVFASAGDCVLPQFMAARVDSTVSEKIFQNLFLLRAGARVDDVLDLVATQARLENIDRLAMIKRMQVAATFAEAIEDGGGKLQSREALKEKWAKLVANADKPGSDGRFNAAKDARLAAVVAILEAFNLAKAGYGASVKADGKSLVAVASGVAALTSAAIDVYSNVVKGALEETSFTFQKLKFFGGIFAGVASMGGAYLAWEDALAYERKKRDDLYGWAIANVTASSLAGIANFLSTLTYCGPWLANVAAKQAARKALIAGATRAAAAAAARMLMYRAILMGFGLAFNIVALGIQVLIWYLSDDELQAWCEKCPFGLERDKSWDVKTLQEEFYKATYAVGA